MATPRNTTAKYLRRQELAARIGIQPKTLDLWVRKGWAPQRTMKVGNAPLWAIATIERWEQDQAEKYAKEWVA